MATDGRVLKAAATKTKSTTSKAATKPKAKGTPLTLLCDVPLHFSDLVVVFRRSAAPKKAAPAPVKKPAGTKSRGGAK